MEPPPTDMNHVKEVKMNAAAEALATLRSASAPIDGLAPEVRPSDLDTAYAVQDRLSQRLTEAGLGRPVGHKIGCTTPVMQQYLRIPHPCSGVMFETTVRRDASTFAGSELCRPGVECELAVELGRDMPSIGRPFTIADCERYVRAVMPSIELVDDRWIDFERVGTPSLVADNFFNAGCVLGPAATTDPDQIAAARGRMWINGVAAGVGTGQDILGHPYEALAWLADHRATRGHPLRTGDVVTLGSVVKTAWIQSGDSVDIEFADLGRASLRLS